MTKPFVDSLLLLPALWLSFISSVILYSYNMQIGYSYTASLLVGLVCFAAMYYLPIRIVRDNYLLIAIMATGLLVYTLVFGDVRGGASRWVNLGFWSFQPGELVKLLFVFILSHIFTADGLKRRYLIAMILSAVYFVLVALQPDLDTALTFIMLFGILFYFRVPFRSRVLPLAVGVVSLALIFTPLVWQYLLKDYQKERVLTFLQPERDPFGSGYHATQALISVGRGGLTGVGIGNGTQFRNSFLPEHTTDFAFASISEELGFIVSVSVVISLGVIVCRLFYISGVIEDAYDANVAMCAGWLLFAHTSMNIGMNIGLVPVMGITLPFVSYGGSAIVLFYSLIGYVSGCYIAQKRLA